MLDLSDVTLAITETRCHKLAQLALIDCLSHAKFGQIVIASDNFKEFEFLGNRAVRMSVPDWPTKAEVQEFNHYRLPNYLDTRYVLFIEWDSWIIDPSAWRSEFKNYDFIGAPWGYTDGYRVGNGGFSLRTTKFMKYLAAHKERFPVTDKSDDMICRVHRPELERAGFSWAPGPLAGQFSTERCALTPELESFGFHGAFLFPLVFAANDEGYIERKLLMEHNPYISDTAMLHEMGLVERGQVPFYPFV